MTELFIAAAFTAFFMAAIDQYIDPIVSMFFLSGVPKIITSVVLAPLGVWLSGVTDIKLFIVSSFGTAFLASFFIAVATRIAVIPVAVSRQLGERR